MLKLKLIKNLRKNLKQGHPWVYKEAFTVQGKEVPKNVSFALLSDNKGEVAKGLFDPDGAIGFRSLEIKEFSEKEINRKIKEAYSTRAFLNKEITTAYRLLAGEGDGLSGLVCDVYNGVAVIQCDGKGIEDFWLSLNVGLHILELSPEIITVLVKSREDKSTIKYISGKKLENYVVRFKENNIVFETDLVKAQKTGFFLDQRDNRSYVRSLAKDKEVWNFFSYTGGFSVYAGLGGAKKVNSLDISQGALRQAQINWELNGLEKSLHQVHEVNVFEFLQSKKLNADLIILDPPSMTSGKDSYERAFKKYVELFSLGAVNTRRGGDLILSSCSSRIDFKSFNEIYSEALSKSSRKAKVMRISGQGPDHPYPHRCEELRYLKFVHLKLD